MSFNPTETTYSKASLQSANVICIPLAKADEVSKGILGYIILYFHKIETTDPLRVFTFNHMENSSSCFHVVNCFYILPFQVYYSLMYKYSNK